MPATDRSPAAPARSPHVLFLGHGAERTGPPILLGHLLRGLRAHQTWDLSVLVARSGPLLDQYREAVGPAGRAAAVSSTREPLEPVGAALRRLGRVRLATRAQDAWRRRAAGTFPTADLIYVNAATPPTAALLRAVSPSPGTPVVLHVHELDIGLRQMLSPQDRAFLFDRADHVIAASEPVADLLIDGHHIDAGRITVCEEFIDVASLAPISRARALTELGVPPRVPVVGSVGLPDWRKDPEHLLRAIATLAPRGDGDPWIVWIGGDPGSPDGVRLADEARRTGLDGRFVHVGHVDDPSRLLAALDVFALPAREDAMPLAALEAAGGAIPIVCFRTGGIAGLCDAGAGTAVDYPDTATFGAAISQLLDDPVHRGRAGRRGRQLVQERNDVGPGVERIAVVIADQLARTT